MAFFHCEAQQCSWCQLQCRWWQIPKNFSFILPTRNAPSVLTQEGRSIRNRTDRKITKNQGNLLQFGALRTSILTFTALTILGLELQADQLKPLEYNHRTIPLHLRALGHLCLNSSGDLLNPIACLWDNFLEIEIRTIVFSLDSSILEQLEKNC